MNILSPSPRFPDRFFNHKMQSYLTDISLQLLEKKSLYEIKIENGEYRFIEQQEILFRDQIRKVLLKTKFRWIQIDHGSGFVIFNFYQHRHWYRYFYTSQYIKTPYDLPSMISLNDHFEWSELINILRNGRNNSGEIRENITFEPLIIYDLLENELGEELIEKIKNGSMITDAMRVRIVSILNKIRNVDSKLIENKHITFIININDNALIFSNKNHFGSNFNVTRHINELLDRKILKFVDNAGHLRIKDDLSKDEINELEWLNIEIMNIVFGNFFRKIIFVFDEKLSKNWYFSVDKYN